LQGRKRRAIGGSTRDTRGINKAEIGHDDDPPRPATVREAVIGARVFSWGLGTGVRGAG
jgi:hypothetical protein